MSFNLTNYSKVLIEPTSSAQISISYDSNSFKGDQVIYAMGLLESNNERIYIEIQDPFTGNFSTLYDETGAAVYIGQLTPPLELINYWGTFRFIKPATTNMVGVIAKNEVGF